MSSECLVQEESDHVTSLGMTDSLDSVLTVELVCGLRRSHRLHELKRGLGKSRASGGERKRFKQRIDTSGFSMSEFSLNRRRQ